ncbi:MAG: methyltransferase domain-containing protein [Terriglobia bacterium]
MSDDGIYHGRILKKSGGGKAIVSAVVVFAALLMLAAKPLLAQNAGPARDAWQHPEEVMDALGVRRGSVVADVGSGEGYFTFHLADRVGPTGHVYAEDIVQSHLDAIQREAGREGLRQISTILGSPDDPHLAPNSLDFVLAVDTYHEWHAYTAMLHHLFLALKPGGIFGLMDGAAPAGFPRAYYYERHRMPEQMERTEVVAAGFRFVRRERGMTRPSDGKQFYFLIFQKPQ